MTTISTITEQDVRNFVGEACFEQGQKYLHDQSVYCPQQADLILRGRCRSVISKSYRVAVILNDTGILMATCSCHIVGDHCQHIAALLLTWLARPEAFQEQLGIEDILQQSNKAELISFIKRMIDRDSDLESLLLVASELGTLVDPQIYQKRVQTLLHASGSKWGTVPKVVDEFFVIAEVGNMFVQLNDYASANIVYDAIVSGMYQHYRHYGPKMEIRELYQIIMECLEGLQQCLGATHNESIREHILRTLFAIYRLDILIGGFGFGDDIPDILSQETTRYERKMIGCWVREAIAEKKLKRPSGERFRSFDRFSFEEEADYDERVIKEWLGRLLLKIEADTLDDASYLRICWETGLIFEAGERLVKLGLIDEAVEATKRLGNYDLGEIAHIFLEYRQEDLIMQFVQERAWKSRNSSLLRWLGEYILPDDACYDAFDQATLQFQETPTIDAYKVFRLFATRCNCWQEKRPEILELLKEKQLKEVLIQILLDEDDTEEIINIIQTAGWTASSSKSLIALIEAAEATQPDVVLHFYQRYVAYLIGKRNRPAYEQVTRILIQMRLLCEKLGKSQIWTRYIMEFCEEYRKLKAFQKILSVSGLSYVYGRTES